MNLLNSYKTFISRLINKWILLSLLGVIVVINIFIFPLLIKPEEKPLDVQLFYSPEKAINYSLQLTQDDIKKSIIMHSSVDILYPCIYTLFLSSIILSLKGGTRLVSVPLLIFTADILENLSIIFLLIIPGQSIFFQISAFVASAATPLKWLSLGICFIIILFLGIRRLFKN